MGAGGGGGYKKTPPWFRNRMLFLMYPWPTQLARVLLMRKPETYLTTTNKGSAEGDACSQRIGAEVN